MVFHGKRTDSIHNSNNQTSVFPGGNHHTLGHRSVLYILAIPSHRRSKRCVFKDWELITTDNLVSLPWFALTYQWFYSRLLCTLNAKNTGQKSSNVFVLWKQFCLCKFLESQKLLKACRPHFENPCTIYKATKKDSVENNLMTREKNVHNIFN